jgi:hypothetical protein
MTGCGDRIIERVATERGKRQAARPASAMTMERKTSICCDFACPPQTAANEVIV